MDQDEPVNQRVHAIAKARGCSVDDVHAALDHHPIELNRDAILKRALALELMRLDQLEMAFERKALEGGDVQSGVLMVKISERRATLLGLNAPLGHAVRIIQHEPAEALTSTQQIRKALDNLMNPALMSPENRARWDKRQQGEPDEDC